jgi:hypothetical protein
MNNEINQKANELVEKYIQASVVIDDGETFYHPKPFCVAKQCAVATCDILMDNAYDSEFFDYWREIKNAIEEL